MPTISTALGATCLALASACAMAQTPTPGAPPTHPAAGGDTTATPSPTQAPTHPAVGTSGATPDKARKEKEAAVNDPQQANMNREGPKAAAGKSTGPNPSPADPKAKAPMPGTPSTPSK